MTNKTTLIIAGLVLIAVLALPVNGSMNKAVPVYDFDTTMITMAKLTNAHSLEQYFGYPESADGYRYYEHIVKVTPQTINVLKADFKEKTVRIEQFPNTAESARKIRNSPYFPKS